MSNAEAHFDLFLVGRSVSGRYPKIVDEMQSQNQTNAQELNVTEFAVKVTFTLPDGTILREFEGNAFCDVASRAFRIENAETGEKAVYLPPLDKAKGRVKRTLQALYNL